MSLTGVVLCGGASSRMGADKANLKLAGKPLALWVVEALAAAGADPVVAQGGTPPPPLVAHPDSDPGAGPLAALVDALERQGDVLVCPTDVPAVPVELLRELAQRAGACDAPVVLAHSDRPEPLIGAYTQASLPLLRDGLRAGARGPSQVLGDADYATVPVAPEAVLNVNTPAELAAAEEMLTKRGRLEALRQG